jgi:hypothetical protein
MSCTAINAAAVEYVAQPDSCAYITSDSMYMLDAGANYKSSPNVRELTSGTERQTLPERFILDFPQIWNVRYTPVF